MMHPGRLQRALLHYRWGTEPDVLPRLRLHLTYMWRHRRRLDLAAPRLFTEHVQHRKLHDRDQRLPLYADKLGVKSIVADRLGNDWVIPTLWHGETLPAVPPWPRPFVVKSRHGCKQIAFVRTPGVDWPALRARAARWVERRYGYWLDEWLYAVIPRGLLVEPFVGTGDRLPVDYKLFVFGGEVAYVQVHLTRERAHRWSVLDLDWRPMIPGGETPPRPASLPAMVAAAQELSRGFAFVRVDFYEVSGVPKFGEMTFYPGSGLDPVNPPHLDAVMGDLWRKALSYTPIAD